MIKSDTLKSHVKEITDQEEAPASVTLGENQRVYQCKMVDCDHHVKGKTFGITRWFKHLVCNCASQCMNDRKMLALLEKTPQVEVLQWEESYRQHLRSRINPMQEEHDVPNHQRPAPRSVNPNAANQRTLDQTNFTDNFSEERDNLKNAAICEFLVHNALSLRLVESPAFLKMARLMNSACKSPKKDAFCTRQLDELHDATVD